MAQRSREHHSHTIFLVEDESLVALGLVKMLERLGYDRVHRFDSAEQALAETEHVRPDVVLVDLRLGEGMQGRELIDEIERRGVCRIIVTTADTEAAELLADSPSVCGVLVKPVVTSQLGRALARAFGDVTQVPRSDDTWIAPVSTPPGP